MNKTHAQLLEVPLEELALLKGKSVWIRRALEDRRERFDASCHGQIGVIAGMLRSLEAMADQVQVEMLKVEEDRGS